MRNIRAGFNITGKGSGFIAKFERLFGGLVDHLNLSTIIPDDLIMRILVFWKEEFDVFGGSGGSEFFKDPEQVTESFTPEMEEFIMMRRFSFLLFLISIGLTSCLPISPVPIVPLLKDEVDLEKYVGHWEMKAIAGVEIGPGSPTTSVDVIRGVSNSLELLFRTPINKGFMIEKCKSFLARDGEWTVLSIKREIDKDWILVRLSHLDGGNRIGLHMIDKTHIKEDILSGAIPGKFTEREGRISLHLTADTKHLREYVKNNDGCFSKDPVALWERVIHDRSGHNE